MTIDKTDRQALELEKLQSEAFNMLLRSHHPVAEGETLLRMMCAGIAASAGRICRISDFGDNVLTPLAFWSSVSSSEDDRNFRHCELADELLLRLKRNETIIAGPSELPEPLGNIYGESLLMAPVNTSACLWGTVCLGSNDRDKTWSSKEILAFRSVVEAFGRAIERADSRDRLERESAKLSGMLEGMEEGMVFADEQGCCVEVNSWFTRFFRLPREKIIGKNIIDLHRGPIREKILKAVEAFKRRESITPLVVQKKLFELDVLMRLQPIYREKVFSGILLNVIPVSELVEARKNAEAASKAKSRFLTNVSHEIRTPLNTIIGFSDLLLGEPLPGDQKEMIRAIKKAGTSLLGIINNILDLSRLEAKGISVETTDFDLHNIVESVVSCFSPQAEVKNIEIRGTVDASVPKTLTGDPARIRQILTSLVSNAVKFTDEGSVSVHAFAGENNRAPTVFIEVKDTGPGIATERLKDIFEPFSQDSPLPANDQAGAGLGLAICKRIASLLDGDISVESSPGKGSRFLLSLPFKADDRPQRRQTVADAGGTSAKRRILVAEDNEVNRTLAIKSLGNFGYDITVAENGAQVLDILAVESNFDVVLLDLQMPLIDGCETTRRIRMMRDVKDIPVVILSASTMEKDKLRCINAGSSDYISKPIDWSDVHRRIDQLLGVKESCKQSPRLAARSDQPTRKGHRNHYGRPQRGDQSEDFTPTDKQLTPVFDREPALKKLCGDEDLLDQVVNVFLRNAQKHLSELENHAKRLSGEDLAKTAHKLKGAAASVGAARVAECASSLETAAKQNELETIDSRIDELKSELRSFSDAVGQSSD